MKKLAAIKVTRKIAHRPDCSDFHVRSTRLSIPVQIVDLPLAWLGRPEHPALRNLLNGVLKDNTDRVAEVNRDGPSFCTPSCGSRRRDAKMQHTRLRIGR